ncbi:MAG: hypothetical protein NVS2B16_25730 [Chloroflexota bacterium]
MDRKKCIVVGASALLLAAGASTASRTHAASSTATSHAATQTIKAAEIKSKYIFKPARDTVKMGLKVRWVNTTDAPHTVTFSQTGMLNKVLGQGKVVTFTPKKAGVYQYRCTYHPGMIGTLVVTR